MPPRKRTKNETCVLCCKDILEGKDEALLCEGEVCCNKWMHRYCAGVSTTHYKLLDESPDPFRCYLCMHLKHIAVVEEMKSAINSLTAEVAELRTALQSAARSCPSGQVQAPTQAQSGRMWNEVVRRGRQQMSKNSSVSGRTQRAQQPMNRLPQTLNMKGEDVSARRVKFSGVRRVWGTRKDAPSSVVLQTVRQLTKADPENRLTVKRKFKEGRYGRRDRWWFLLHGPESILDELSSAWSSVSLQLGWKLEECTKPYEDENSATRGNEGDHERENEGEQNKEPDTDSNATDSRTSQSEQATTVGEDSANMETIAPTRTDESNAAPFLGENNSANS